MTNVTKSPKLVSILTSKRCRIYFKGNPTYKEMQYALDKIPAYQGQTILKFHGKKFEQNSIFYDKNGVEFSADENIG